MKLPMSFLVLCAVSLVLILVAVSYYLFSKIAASTSSQDLTATSDGGDSLRKHGVTDLASKISYIAGDGSVSWPSELMQIGSDTSGCQLNTLHCQVTSDKCFNLEAHTGSRFKLPTDPIEGTQGKTGYAVIKNGDTLEIIACLTEAPTPITQRLRF